MAITVNVLLLSGRAVHITAAPDSSVFLVQSQAQKAFQLQIERLLAGDRILTPGRTLKEEQVADGTVLTAVIRPDRLFSCRWSSAFTLVRSDGSVVTWGDPDRGGDSSRVQAQLQDIDTVLGAEYTQAALLLDGTVVMWGSSGWHGEHESLQQVRKLEVFPHGLAAIKFDSSVILLGRTRSMAAPPPLGNVRQIAACQGSMSGAYAAVLHDGRVRTWGCPKLGGSSSEVESELYCVREIKACSSTFAGAFAAIREDGRVITWGSRTYGGDSTAVREQLHDVTDVVSTCFAFAAVKKDGNVVCWGAPEFGGDCVSVQEELHGVKYVCATSGAFAALCRDGSVSTWGCQQFGGDCSGVKAKLSAVRDVVASGAAFAALRSDGTVVTWGHVPAGGDSSSAQARLTNVRQIVASAYAFAALRSDGEVVTWGQKDWGGALACNWEEWTADPRLVTWTLTGLAKKRRLATALLVLQSMRHGLLEVNIFHVTAVMSAGRATHRWATSLVSLRHWCDRGLAANTVARNAAVAAAALGDWRFAQALASEACKQGSVDHVTLGSAMAALSWTKALSLLAQSPVLLRKPLDPICLRTAMTSCEKSSGWEQTLHIFRHFHGRPGDIGAASFNPAISACEKGLQWQLSFRILGMAGECRWKPSDVSWAAVASACEKAGPWQRALHILGGSQRSGLWLFSSAMSACMHAGVASWCRALQLLRCCIDAGMQPSTVSYSAVLEVCRRTGSWRRVSQLLRTMGTQRLPSSVIALNTAMLACLRSGLSEQVLRLFGDVKRQSLQPTSLTLSHVADALSHSPTETVPLLVRLRDDFMSDARARLREWRKVGSSNLFYALLRGELMRRLRLSPPALLQQRAGR
ncbi:unnamed protein product [Symbiodinium microadriaticum]|nr:unnamed protein product [Symbiodinium microadriaticum]